MWKSSLKEGLAVTFLGGGAHVFRRRGYLSPFEGVSLIFSKGIGPPHLGVRFLLKEVTTPLDFLGVVHLHP